MNLRTLALLVVLAAFSVLSAHAMLEVGYLGIWRAGFASWGGMQLLADLVIACSLAALWIHDDARRRGLNPWPFMLMTLVAGSFGPLCYLLARARRAAVGPLVARA
ncbi:MAG: DUF2834 domain-containing protein [Gammaproteobacteria bacterium]